MPTGAIHAPARTHTPPRSRHVRAHIRALYARPRTYSRASSDLKGEFNDYLLKFKAFLKNSCKFLTYIELRILILKYKILRFN
nr:MAG TPA: hypothetical protein [Caudoviricetes sp.]